MAEIDREKKWTPFALLCACRAAVHSPHRRTFADQKKIADLGFWRHRGKTTRDGGDGGNVGTVRRVVLVLIHSAFSRTDDLPMDEEAAGAGALFAGVPSSSCS
ncbi:hypothetical protein U1Q18_004649 [Sarracenia purpurea var. burkii]